jgi:hypothetical protein
MFAKRFETTRSNPPTLSVSYESPSFQQSAGPASVAAARLWLPLCVFLLEVQGRPVGPGRFRRSRPTLDHPRIRPPRCLGEKKKIDVRVGSARGRPHASFLGKR